MTKERRKGRRDQFVGRLAGQLSLAVDGSPVPVQLVYDVSPFGVGMLVEGEVGMGGMAQLAYRDGEQTMVLSGSVVWTVPDATGVNSRIGIYLDADNGASNIAFFQALLG